MRHGRLDHEQVWAQYSTGQLPAEIGRSMGRPPDAIRVMIRKAGGIRPAPRGMVVAADLAQPLPMGSSTWGR